MQQKYYLNLIHNYAKLWENSKSKNHTAHNNWQIWLVAWSTKDKRLERLMYINKAITHLEQVINIQNFEKWLILLISWFIFIIYHIFLLIYLPHNIQFLVYANLKQFNSASNKISLLFVFSISVKFQLPLITNKSLVIIT